jgi:hypothetical protein
VIAYPVQAKEQQLKEQLEAAGKRQAELEALIQEKADEISQLTDQVKLYLLPHLACGELDALTLPSSEISWETDDIPYTCIPDLGAEIWLRALESKKLASLACCGRYKCPDSACWNPHSAQQ